MNCSVIAGHSHKVHAAALPARGARAALFVGKPAASHWLSATLAPINHRRELIVRIKTPIRERFSTEPLMKPQALSNIVPFKVSSICSCSVTLTSCSPIKPFGMKLFSVCYFSLQPLITLGIYLTCQENVRSTRLQACEMALPESHGGVKSDLRNKAHSNSN